MLYLIRWKHCDALNQSPDSCPDCPSFLHLRTVPLQYPCARTFFCIQYGCSELELLGWTHDDFKKLDTFCRISSHKRLYSSLPHCSRHCYSDKQSHLTFVLIWTCYWWGWPSLRHRYRNMTNYNLYNGYCTLNRLHYNINRIFMCTGKSQNSCDLLYCDICFIAVGPDPKLRYLQGVAVKHFNCERPKVSLS